MSFRTHSNNLFILTSVEVVLFGRSTQIDRKKLLAIIKPGHVAYKISATQDSSSC